MRFTKITSSIGPTSESAEMIAKMYQAGTSMFRLNFSHDVGDVQGAKVRHIRAIGKPAAILADLQGPKHRIGDFKDGQVALNAGDKFIFDNNPEPGDATRVYLPEKEVLDALNVGDTILLNDGKQEFKVTAKSDGLIETKVIRGGTNIKSKRGFNLPSTEIPGSVLTEKDRVDLEYALTQDIDYVAISFVQKPEDIIETREFIRARTDKKIKLVAKIERPQAIERIEEIIKEVDVIMIARGDLAVEVPLWKVPELSRKMVRLCREYNKPVIMATQMLSSMQDAEFPTRAEISDVANAAYWRVDSTMTSEETTVGINPVLTTETMAKILENADIDGARDSNPWATRRVENHWSESVVQLAELNEASAIVCFSHGGTNAREISARKTDLPIIVIAKDALTANQCCLLRGVFPIHNEKMHNECDYKSALKEFGITGKKIVTVTDNEVKLETL